MTTPKRLLKKLDNSLQGRERTREIVRIRDNYICQRCKKVWTVGTRRFDVHHLNGLCGRLSKNYDRVSEIDGLITLCHNCHMVFAMHKDTKTDIINNKHTILQQADIDYITSL